MTKRPKTLKDLTVDSDLQEEAIKWIKELKDMHPKFNNRPAVEIVLTKLHAGAKFGRKTYRVAGGLHGLNTPLLIRGGLFSWEEKKERELSLSERVLLIAWTKFLFGIDKENKK